MSKETLKTNNAGLFGKKLNLPIAGETEISKDGEIEVETAVADLLVNNHDGTFFREGDVKEIEVEAEEVKAKPQTKAKAKVEEKEVEEAEEEEEAEEVEADLGTLSLEELIELAKEAGFKEPTYRKFKKDPKLMIAFLKKNV